MPTAEIIAIGTELLLGEIQDTNTRYLARKLRDEGIDIYRATIVGDNTERIAQAIGECLERAHILITTGGLGPTVDDPTRQAVALAMSVDLEFRAELWEQIQARFQRFNRTATENNRRQAFIPKGALPVENPVGTAPAFVYEKGERSIISLPGVPREMEYLTENFVLPYLKQRYQLKGTILARVLHCAGVGESQVDEWIADLETYTNPTVGLLAHPGQVDIRITAKADSKKEAEQLIDQLSQEVYQRLGQSIYGEDQQTLAGILREQLTGVGFELTAIECNLDGELISQLLKDGFNPECGKLYPEPATHEQMVSHCQEYAGNAHIVLCASLAAGKEKQTLSLLLITPSDTFEGNYSYGGPPGNAPFWAANMSLDFVRRHIGR
jgi:nicotinamide-nucleotide amidase